MITQNIILIGIAQALFLAVAVLFKNTANAKPNGFLSALLVFFAMGLITHYLSITDLWQQAKIPYLLFSTSIFLFGPSLYFYVVQLTHPNKKIGIISGLNLLPWLANLLLLLPYFLMPNEDFISEQLAAQQLNSSVLILPIAKTISVAIYGVLSLRVLQKYQLGLKQRFSDIDRFSLNWLILLTGGFLIIDLFFIAILVTGQRFDGLSYMTDTVISLLLVFLIFMIGFRGIKQDVIFSLDKDEHSKTVDKVKYQNRNISQSQGKTIQTSLAALMLSEKVFLDRDLSLSQLAVHLKISAHQLSQCLNETMQTNFYEYINRLRIEEAKKRLVNERSKPILDIALEVGFNNKATFNKAFRQSTKSTPSYFRKENQ